MRFSLLLGGLATLLAFAPAPAQQVLTLPFGPVAGIAGEPVIFTATPLPGSTGTIVQFQWDFGDGQTGGGATTTHTYATPGAYTVTVTALGASGAIASATTTASISLSPIEASNAVPGASVSSPLGFVSANANGPYSGTVGTPLAFTATTANATAPLFTWQFGDNLSAAGQSVTHTYQAPGTYTVRLAVTDIATGATGFATTTATLGANPAVTAAALAAITPIANATAGPVVSYPAGWNLIAGPAGTAFPQAESPIYTWQPGDTSYEQHPSGAGVQAGASYWAYFPQAAMVALSGVSSDSFSLSVPAGEMVLIGNPSATHAVVIHGADSATIWDSGAGLYRSAQSLAPGAGAWIYVASGGVVMLSP